MSDGEKVNDAAGSRRELEAGDETELGGTIDKYTADLQDYEHDQKENFEKLKNKDFVEGRKREKDQMNKEQKFVEMELEDMQNVLDPDLIQHENDGNGKKHSAKNKEENNASISPEHDESEVLEKQDYEVQEKHMNVRHPEGEILLKQQQERNREVMRSEKFDHEKQTDQPEPILESEQAEGQDFNSNEEMLDQSNPEEDCSEEHYYYTKLIAEDVDDEISPLNDLENLFQYDDGRRTLQDMFSAGEIEELTPRQEQVDMGFSDTLQARMRRQLRFEQLVSEEMASQNILDDMLPYFEQDVTDDDDLEVRPSESEDNAL